MCRWNQNSQMSSKQRLNSHDESVQCGFPGVTNPCFVVKPGGLERDRKELRSGHGPCLWPPVLLPERAMEVTPEYKTATQQKR